MERTPSSGPVRLREILLSESPTYPRLAAVTAWRRVAGPALAARSRVQWRDGWLEVTVGDERWLRVLEGMSASLLERVRDEPGAGGVKGIRLLVDESVAPRPGSSSPERAARGRRRGRPGLSDETEDAAP